MKNSRRLLRNSRRFRKNLQKGLKSALRRRKSALKTRGYIVYMFAREKNEYAASSKTKPFSIELGEASFRIVCDNVANQTIDYD